MEEKKDPAVVEKHQAKPTQQAMEKALQWQVNLRNAKLGQLTEKRKKTFCLLESDCHTEKVDIKLIPDLNQLLDELCESNLSVRDQLHNLKSEVEMNNDQLNWFKPKATDFRKFCDDVARWIKCIGKVKVNEVNLEEIVSLAYARRCRKSKSSSVASSASKVRLTAKLDMAALLAKSETLKQLCVLEEQELKLAERGGA
ncbi:hypothetical protein Q5P01_024781 [Channa striata]|uniref:Uncharacterized protein n=1 Tax=Channa striata TaxID=64152 RepID=A0AA88LJY7_CHASR|nr:hypothetical protein Q5P01_024781 [Channa striata]